MILCYGKKIATLKEPMKHLRPFLDTLFLLLLNEVINETKLWTEKRETSLKQHRTMAGHFPKQNQ